MSLSLSRFARLYWVFALIFPSLIGFASADVAHAKAAKTKPLSVAQRKISNSSSVRDHLIVMVFDQMRPDYLDRYDLPNFKRIRKSGMSYPNAYVGHLGAETVVSHFVISSGVLPKEMPWKDEVFVDTGNLLGSGAGAAFVSGGLNVEQFGTLMRELPQETFLPAKLKRKFPDGKVYAVGEKSYATIVFGTTAADSIITFSKSNGVCSPAGRNVPDYISGNSRYVVGCRDSFGTAGSLYPLDGAKSVPGHDPAHQGGDVWVADVAREIMERDANWRGLFLTFAGIDKLGHMTGDIDVKMPHSFDSEYSMGDALRIADAQLGRVLDKLQERGLTDRTLIVITADHGAQSNVVYLGNGQKSHGGDDLANDRSSPQSFFIDRILRTGRIRMTYQDTSIRLWLRPGDPVAPAAGGEPVSDTQLVRVMSETSGLVEIYRLTQSDGRYSYSRVFQNLTGQTAVFRRWAAAHHQELVDSMASIGAPDLIGLMADGYGFDMMGDHGGAQERAQRIPMLFHGPGVPKEASPHALRLVDLNQQISKWMEL